jgi:hypothetical protein
MITMATKYSPSINIKRDVDSEYLYIPTKNSLEAYNTISNNFKAGIHSYNIIGSYGTGKSAFLLAFYKHLNKSAEYFRPVNGQFNGCSKFSFIQVVGSYESIVTSLAKELKVSDDEAEVYEAIKNLQTKLRKKKECLVLVIDEFGKTLEFSAKNNPEKELYFIQRIAEYANDSKRNFLFITTLHQNFDAYAIGLDEKDRKEWEKVKGRIKELPFNEPVEQMLELAGQGLQENFKDIERKSLSKKFFNLIKKSNLFKLRNELSIGTAQKLFPLDPLSASCLLVALQKYGQNERSLFSFISSKEPYGLREHITSSKQSFYSIVEVYDFLIFNYSYLLQSKNNPDFFKWRVILTAIDRVDSILDKEIENSKKVIKVIGLLNLINGGASKINVEFLNQYFKEVVGIKSILPALEELEQKKIIKYHKFKDSYGIYEGTDIDIEYEIAEKKKEVGSIVSVIDEIRKYISLDYVVAKAISFKKGTPRIFEYKYDISPISTFENSRSEIDGFINVVFDKHDEYIKKLSKVKAPIIYCFIEVNEMMIRQLSDINVVDRILVENVIDKVARQELIEYRDSQVSFFMEYFKSQLFSSESTWLSRGILHSFESEKQLNKELSAVVSKVYSATPVYKNELINKSKLSGTMQYAKKSFITAMMDNWSMPYFGFEGSKFPPERTIYHSLLEDTGIHISDDLNQSASFAPPTNKSFLKLWEVCNKFVDDSKKGKRPVSELVDTLKSKPFKLKDGFIEFWLLSYLFIHREEYALYMDGVYIPVFSLEVADLLFKKANSFSIKGIEVDGVRLSLFNKYRSIINKVSSKTIKNKGFQEVAKPFLVFYKQLSPYSKVTTKYLSKETIALRETLLNAKELEKTFFDDLPKCFGYSLRQLEKSKQALNDFATKLQAAIKELRLQDAKLSERILISIKNHFNDDNVEFEEFRAKVQKRYSKEMEHLLDPKQRSLVKRIQSQIPDSDLWVSSIVQMLIAKPLNKINDEEEVIIYDRLSKQLNDLDGLVEISKLDYNAEKEVALRYEIQGSDKKRKKNQLVLNKKELKEIGKLKKEILSLIDSHDIKVKEGLLIQMLKEI